jgi:tRNA U34 5-methylaminomethyl-2-thiouridine-forming methyltransferase MnmC
MPEIENNKPYMEYTSILTADGSPTLLHPAFGETYSSVHGAWMQANELYVKLTQTHLHPNPTVLEIGFGLGMNVRATLQNALGRGVRFEYTSYEGFPVSGEVLASVGVELSPQAQQVWSELLDAWPNIDPPPPALQLSGDWGRLEIRFVDVLGAAFPLNWASAIYLDPFSPEVNPEPWSIEVGARLFAAARAGARLATYSVAGLVRRNLIAAGFRVQKQPGMGKKQWLLGQR